MGATETLPLLPVRGQLVLPGTTMRANVGRAASVRLVQERILTVVRGRGGRIAAGVMLAVVPVPVPVPGVSAVGLGGSSTPASPKEELCEIGCVARVTRLEETEVTVAGGAETRYILTLEGVQRLRVHRIASTEPYLTAEVERLVDVMPDKDDASFSASVETLKAVGRELLELLSEVKLPPALVSQMRQYIESTPPGALADLLTAALSPSFADKLEVLRAVHVADRVARTASSLQQQVRVLRLSQSVVTTVEGRLNKKQREAFLRQQLKAIREELGEHDDPADEGAEIDELAKRLGEANLPDEVDKVVRRDLRRLRRTPPAMAEHATLRTYLERIADMPWGVYTDGAIDIERTQKQLDDDHYGLDKVKRRIVEFLAVRQLRRDMRGPILCLVGPPGVGKTSLGRSIADALGRKFFRVSLGGVRDETEIRGHRRTYIGAMPGRIVDALSRVGVSDPVILLDEIDKLGKDIRGDPAAALLEVLDPEQNSTFTDHYMGVPVDLSRVLFIATANDADAIPRALADRMETIRIPGYMLDEKLQIARRHLVPKQFSANGLQPEQLEIPDDVLQRIARAYTREPGVRGLERHIAAVCRSYAVERVRNREAKAACVAADDLERILGPPPFEEDPLERASVPGVSVGLAWTSTGDGSVLFVEASKLPGKGRLQLTGQLGDVMRESAQAALSWVRSNASLLAPWGAADAARALDMADVHLHFPEGATPKDGPSAGVTIVTALVSMLAGQPLRPLTAMTGEITLRGLVLPVGGIRDKVLAAHRFGVKRVIMPLRNRKDLVDVPAKVRDAIEFVFARRITDVLESALEMRDAQQPAVIAPVSHL